MIEYKIDKDIILFTANKQCTDDIVLRRADGVELAKPTVTHTDSTITVAVDQPAGYIENTVKSFKYPLDVADANEQYLANVLNGDVTEIISDKIVKIPDRFQDSNTKLTWVSLPNVTKFSYCAFSGCKKLKYINLKSATTMPASTADSCSELRLVNLDSLVTINDWGYNFNQDSKLLRMDFPKLTGSITGGFFVNCKKLTAVVLRANTVVPLENTNAFNQTPIALYNNTVGYIYVPAALVDSYKVATNWATYANQIRAIEDYPVICGGDFNFVIDESSAWRAETGMSLATWCSSQYDNLGYSYDSTANRLFNINGYYVDFYEDSAKTVLVDPSTPIPVDKFYYSTITTERVEEPLPDGWE